MTPGKLSEQAASVKIPAHLTSLLSKEQMCIFLGLPKNTKESKEAIVQQLQTLLGTDPQENARFFELFVQEMAVEPWELERLLGCTTNERKRWLADGKLTALEMRSISKHGRELLYPVFDRRSAHQLTQEDIERWRAEHTALVDMRRKTGARRASASRVENEQARKNAVAQVERMLAEVQQENPGLAVVFRLAYWTVWASRWAKENQVRARDALKYHALYAQRREQWYARKDEALLVLARSPYACVTFYRPEDADKISLSLCDEHYEEMRGGSYDGKWDLYAANKSAIKQCPLCELTIEPDYYALYSIEIVACARPDIRFAFHIPSALGRTFLPPSHTLPQVQHEEREEGMFRFGRRLGADEKILYREKDVQLQMKQALADARRLFEENDHDSL